MSDANPTPVSANRNADGINEKELACAIAQSEYEHEHGHHHSHDGVDFYDYTQAVREYKKTFANKQQVIEQTPDPAVRDMLLRMQELRIDTVFDRFDAPAAAMLVRHRGHLLQELLYGPVQDNQEGTAWRMRRRCRFDSRP